MNKIYQVDAFTREPFQGNPAAVCILKQSQDAHWMQNVALEMNLSETAFLVPQEDGFQLRWFTPAVEVALCGHATLASAHILWETGVLGGEEKAIFHTLSGVLTAARNGSWIELNFPSTPEEAVDTPPGLVEALGVQPLYTGQNQYDYLVEVESEEQVINLKPDFKRLKEMDVRGIMVTSRATRQGFDFVSRFFAPGAGIDEDPVTGSAHCCLGPFWRDKTGKDDMTAYQASARGGVVKVRVAGERIILSGQAVTTMEGVLRF